MLNTSNEITIHIKKMNVYEDVLTLSLEGVFSRRFQYWRVPKTHRVPSNNRLLRPDSLRLRYALKNELRKGIYLLFNYEIILNV